LSGRSVRVSADALWLGAILALAAVLRVIGLDAGLWYDEIDTLVHYVRRPVVELVTNYPSLNHHVLFSLQARLSVLLFGESAWALRLPAFLFGVASIWALWLLARQVSSAWVARLAALLLAVSYHHIWFSQNARGYTGILFWCILATYFFVRGWREGGRRFWTLYAGAMALALYTHLSAIFFFAAHGVVYLGLAAHRLLSANSAEPRLTWPLVQPALALAVGGLAAALLHAPLVPSMIATFSEVAAPQPEAIREATAHWKSPLWMAAEIGRGLSGQNPLLALAGPIALLVIVAGMIRVWRREPILPALFLLHILLTLALILALSFRLWPRYFFVDIGFICFFLVEGAFAVAEALARLLRRERVAGLSPGGLGIAFALVGVTASCLLLPRNYAFPKQDFAGARDFVESNRGPDSAVLTLGLASMPYADYYAPHWREVDSVEEVKAGERSSRDVWLVYSFPPVTEQSHRAVTDYVNRTYRSWRFPGTLHGGDVLVFRSRRERIR
jgi:mannosyltransferase